MLVGGQSCSKAAKRLSVDNDGLVLRYECLHDAPANEIGHGTDAEDYHVSGRLVVNKNPDGCPDEAEQTDDDECHLPTQALGQQGNGGGSCQGAYRGTGIEDRGCEGAVLLGEVLGRHLDGCGEVASLTEAQDNRL